MIKILKTNDRKISKWSGGVTEQLYIYPETSDYSKRDFIFRISIATTEVENSQFTKLPDVKRVISILDGTMELVHEGHHKTTLNKYDIDRFSGDWDTFSKGKVRDFNLMIKNSNGDFQYKNLSDNDILTINNEANHKFVFCIDGELSVNNCTLKREEIAIISNENVSISGIGKIFYGYIK